VDELPRHLDRICGLIIEGRNHREDSRAGVCGEAHVADVDFIEGSLAETEHQRATLLEADVCGALDEVAGEAICNSSERSHAAGHDDHAGGRVAAAGDGGSYVTFSMLRDFRGGVAEKFFGEVVATGDAQLFGQNAK